MTASIAEQAMETVAAKFTANVAGATTFRSRRAALALSEGIVIIVEPDEEPVTYLSVDKAKRELMLKVTILARGNVPDQTADPVRVLMHSTLMSDPTLGGLTLRIVEEATKWTYEEADLTAVSVESRYKLIYLSPTGSITSLA